MDGHECALIRVERTAVFSSTDRRQITRKFKKMGATGKALEMCVKKPITGFRLPENSFKQLKIRLRMG